MYTLNNNITGKFIAFVCKYVLLLLQLADFDIQRSFDPYTLSSSKKFCYLCVIINTSTYVYTIYAYINTVIYIFMYILDADKAISFLYISFLLVYPFASGRHFVVVCTLVFVILL